MPTSFTTLPAPIQAMFGPPAPLKRPRPRPNLPPWLQNVAISGPQARSMTLPQLGQDLAALLGARAAAAAPRNPFLNLLLRR